MEEALSRWYVVMIKKIRLFVWCNIVVFSLFSFLGCGPSLYDYRFELNNNRESGECAMLLKSKKGSHLQSNHIMAKTWKTYHGPFKYPPNDLYSLYWVDENGDQYSAEADLRDIISKDFKGYLIFKIDNKNNLIYSVSNSYKGDELFNKTIKGKNVQK